MAVIKKMFLLIAFCMGLSLVIIPSANSQNTSSSTSTTTTRTSTTTTTTVTTTTTTTITTTKTSTTTTTSLPTSTTTTRTSTTTSLATSTTTTRMSTSTSSAQAGATGTSSYSTVGTACTSNSTCTGPNEFCYNIAWLSPTCSTGVCQCLPCYTTGDFSGAVISSSSSSYLCVPLKALSLGDSCNGTYNELILTPYASCSSGTVQCNSDYTASGSLCVRSGGTGLGYGETCDYYTSVCYGELYCIEDETTSTYSCQCYYPYEKWDTNSSSCVKKEFGDPCNDNSDCQVDGKNWEGFTWNSAFCSSEKKCSCGNNTQAVTGYIDPITGVFKNKTICVAAGGTVGVASGGECTVDPIYYGDNADVEVCSSTQVCVACPEDNSWSTGKCRSIVGTKPSRPVCYAVPSASTTGTGGSGSSGTGSGSTGSGSGSGTGSGSGSTGTGSSSGSTGTSGPVTYSCGGSPCNGTSFRDDTTSQNRCLQNGTIYYCSSSSGSGWTLVTSATINSIPCQGNFNFTIMAGKYWLYGSTLLNWNGTTWNAVPIPDYYKAYGALLGPNEGSGSFYCTVPYTSGLAAYYSYYSSATFAFYYNGSYYSLATDSSGKLYQVAMSIPPYVQYAFSAFATQNETGCTMPACIWCQDVANSSVVNLNIGSTVYSSPYTKFMYNGSLWYYFTNGTYKLYTGPITPGIYRAFPYFNNFLFKIANGTKYQFLHGSLFQVTSKDQAVGNPVYNLDYWQYVDKDPLATGGYFYTWQQTMQVMYKNLTGDYQASIVNGFLTLKRPPPSCGWGEKPSGNPSPTCTPEEDSFPLTSITVCDPNQSPSICGDGYICSKIPSAIAMTCAKGICTPDRSIACGNLTTMAPTTTVAGTKSTGLKKYGTNCTTGTECYTGICTNNICSCSDCTKILPGFDWSWARMSVIYRESCIPQTSTIGGLGDACNMWANAKQAACGMGLYCAKCPEKWNAAFANATCLRMNLPTTSDTCPASQCTGYLASCSMVGGDPTCTCPTGYNLDSDMKNCYGWKVTGSTDCSVTCGIGTLQITRVCDKKNTSSAVCSGNATVTAPCYTSLPCPLPPQAVASAVYIAIQSNVLTPTMFDNYVKPTVSDQIVRSLNAKCQSDSSTYESQCCPGKKWSSDIVANDCFNATAGMTYLSEFSDNVTFSFYLLATPNSKSVCCASAKDKGRRRRDATIGVDQSFLASLVNSPAVMSVLTDAVQNVDPNAVVPQNAATVVTTTTTAATVKAVSSSTSGGIPDWGYIIIGVFCGVIVIGIIVGVAIFLLQRQKARAKIAAANATMAMMPGVGPRVPVELRGSANGMRTNSYSANNQTVGGPAAGAYPPYYGGRYPPSAAQAEPAVFHPEPAHGY